MTIKLYEISQSYITYLSQYEPLLFHNKRPGQQNERKYIGVVFSVNEMDYFAPLSSFKKKHKHMPNGLDFIKIKNYAVINLNNMFPAPLSECTYVDISKEPDERYKALLISEYRFIKSIQGKIRKNAAALYAHKVKNGNSTNLAKRCNDFLMLEKAYKSFLNGQI